MHMGYVILCSSENKVTTTNTTIISRFILLQCNDQTSIVSLQTKLQCDKYNEVSAADKYNEVAAAGFGIESTHCPLGGSCGCDFNV